MTDRYGKDFVTHNNSISKTFVKSLLLRCVNIYNIYICKIMEGVEIRVSLFVLRMHGFEVK